MFGAAWATVLSEFLVFLVSAKCLVRFVSWKELLSIIGIPAVSILIVQSAWIFFKLTPNIWTLFLSFVIYSFPLIVLAKRQAAK
jgi:hypothetical protein